LAQVGIGSTIPLAGDGTDTTVTIEGGAAAAAPSKRPRVWYSVVSSQYLDAMGIRPGARPRRSATRTMPPAPVVIVNRAFARTHFGGDEQAIGKAPSERAATKSARGGRIVGSADDVRLLFGVGNSRSAERLPFRLGQRAGRPRSVSCCARRSIPGRSSLRSGARSRRSIRRSRLRACAPWKAW
jgi:hypothetical protein